VSCEIRDNERILSDAVNDLATDVTALGKLVGSEGIGKTGGL